MLQEMKGSKPFDFEYVNVNRKKGTGGERKTMTKAILASDHLSSFDQGSKAYSEVSGSSATTKNPAIMCFYSAKSPKGEQKFRHIWVHLITLFNGRPVI